MTSLISFVWWIMTLLGGYISLDLKISFQLQQPYHILKPSNHIIPFKTLINPSTLILHCFPYLKIILNGQNLMLMTFKTPSPSILRIFLTKFMFHKIPTILIYSQGGGIYTYLVFVKYVLIEQGGFYMCNKVINIHISCMINFLCT